MGASLGDMAACSLLGAVFGTKIKISRGPHHLLGPTGTQVSSPKRMKSAQLLVGVLFDSGSLFDGSKKRRFSKIESGRLSH